MPESNLRPEDDVQADPHRVNSREGGDYVGRVAEDDTEVGESGAERRAEAEAQGADGTDGPVTSEESAGIE